jgi:hypothetical protein
MHERTLPGHTRRYILTANPRASHVDQSATSAEIAQIIARVPKSVNFDRWGMVSLQSRHTGPIYQFEAQEGSGTAQIGPAWRFSTAKGRTRVVFAKREWDNRSEVYGLANEPKERPARAPLASGGRPGPVTVDRYGPECCRRGAWALPVTAFDAARFTQSEGKSHGEVDCLNCLKPSPDSATLGGLGLRVPCLVTPHVSVERFAMGSRTQWSGKDTGCVISEGSRGAARGRIFAGKPVSRSLLGLWMIDHEPGRDPRACAPS